MDEIAVRLSLALAKVLYLNQIAKAQNTAIELWLLLLRTHHPGLC